MILLSSFYLITTNGHAIMRLKVDQKILYIYITQRKNAFGTNIYSWVWLGMSSHNQNQGSFFSGNSTNSDQFFDFFIKTEKKKVFDSFDRELQNIELRL